jgi:hypothetical protein
MSTVAFRPNRGLVSLKPLEARERSTRRAIATAWGLLMLDTLQYVGLLVHVPGVVGKLITQGALPLALLVALSVNRKLILRPNVFLSLATLLVIEAAVTSLTAEHIGDIYRGVRLAEFVFALWLLTPWWGRRDLLLVRSHLTVLSVILGSVLLGVLVAPGKAFTDGRLSGAIWVIPPTQVAHYAAVVIGLTVVLWLCGQVPGRMTLAVIAVVGGMLILTRTRTALIGLVAGLLVASLSLIVARARVRKLFAIGGIVVGVATITLGSFFVTFLTRGQSGSDLTSLTGRTHVWSQVLAVPRDPFQKFFGFGLSNASFNGLSIDSNWFSSYDEQGLFGVAICAAMLLFLLINAYFQQRGVQRAMTLFLVTYCLIVSFTEDAFTNASPYLLDLTLAASLLVTSAVDRDPTLVSDFRLSRLRS